MTLCVTALAVYRENFSFGLFHCIKKARFFCAISINLQKIIKKLLTYCTMFGIIKVQKREVKRQL